MEGCATAVSETLALPAQPASGEMRRIPLGGDGFTAPIAAYAIINFAQTGATGGGSIRHRISMDERFCSLVSYMTVRNVQATPGNVDVKFIVAGPANPLQTLNHLAVATSATISTTTITETWNPTPYILPGGGAGSYCALDMLNVDADVVTLDCLIYLFDVSVREKTAMGPLLWSRGAT